MRISDWSSDVCSSDLLPLAAVRWRIDDLRRGAQQRHAIRLDHRIQRERRTGLTLAPAAMAAMHEQRFRFEPVAHEAAITAAFDREGAHVVSSRKFGRADWRSVTRQRSEEHTSELQSLMRNSYAVFCLKKK